LTTPGVLASKLMPPMPPPALVARSRIAERIAATPAARLVLVQGPAGFGKSTAMRQYYADAQAAGLAVSWLRLDSADNDVDRFLAHLAPALARLDADAAPAPVTLDCVHQVADYEAPFVLFIDEFELLDNPVVIALVRQMMDAAPGHGQFVVGSRKVPDLGLGRLRARNLLVEIGPADLRFALDETVELVRTRHRLPLSDDDLGQLQRCTEGWPAALHLASLSLASCQDRSGFVARFSGSNADITDYLAEDILARQPQSVRQFLLQTSVLDELCAPLCDAVCGRDDSAAMLAQLEQANLFITPLDSQRQWYRYHSLFSEFLHAQLQRQQFGALAPLHLAASAWYEAQARPVPAIEHALAASDVGRALALLAVHADPLIAHGRFGMLRLWFAALPDKALQPHPQLRISYAWVLSSTHNPAKAMAILEDIEQAAAPATLDNATRASVPAMRSLVHMMLDAPQACLDATGQDWPGMAADAPTAHATNAFFRAICLSTLDRFDEAIHTLDSARRSHASVGHVLGLALAERVHGAIEISQGRLGAATQRLQRALGAIAAQGAHPLGLGATVGVMLATALYERDELVEAERLLREYLSVANEAATPDLLICGHVTLARIVAIAGDQAGALALLADLEHLGHQWSLPRLVASAWLERARFAIAAQDYEAARDYLRYANNREVWLPFARFTMHANDLDTPSIGRLRLCIRSGEAAAVLPELRQRLREAEQKRRQRRALKLRILLAEALELTGQPSLAVRTLSDALRMAAPEGFVRTFAEESGTIAGRLLAMHQAGVGGDPDAAVPLAFVARILQAMGQAVAGGEAHEKEKEKEAADSPQLHQAIAQTGITNREIRVLQLLAKGYTNAQIAQQLFVAHSTVNAHLRNINQKLEVHNRTQAVARARELRLVS